MRIGIDLGGTKIEILALDYDGKELERKRVPTPRGDYQGCIAAVRDLVLGAEAKLGRTGTVGIGIPGAVSPATGLVKNGNSVWLNGQPLDRDLSAALDRPVKVENDANCFAVSEAVDGAGQGQGVVFGAILGTGVGSGIAIDRKPLSGRHHIGGEWGHNPLPWPTADEMPGPPCFCGRKGCIEQWVAGPAMARDHHAVTGETRHAEDIMISVGLGDERAKATYERYVQRLARAMAHVVNILDPDVIVLGGGMGNIAQLYEDLPKLMPAFVFSDVFTTPIRKPVHGDSSGVRGAAWLWQDKQS
jgi:fructokinase